MKFICSVTIQKPKELVASYFADPAHLGKYQDGFVRKELISGTIGSEGAISKMYYIYNKKEMDLTETILSNNLPDAFMAQYHHKSTDNTMKSTFIALNNSSTKYEAEIHYTAFRGFVIKVIAFLFPSFFKKQVDKWLLNFKLFLEELDA